MWKHRHIIRFKFSRQSLIVDRMMFQSLLYFIEFKRTTHNIGNYCWNLKEPKLKQFAVFDFIKIFFLINFFFFWLIKKSWELFTFKAANTNRKLKPKRKVWPIQKSRAEKLTKCCVIIGHCLSLTIKGNIWPSERQK